MGKKIHRKYLGIYILLPIFIITKIQIGPYHYDPIPTKPNIFF